MAALVGVAVAWGLSFVVIKDAVDTVAPSDLVGWRFTIAAVVLLVLRPRSTMILDGPTLRSGAALGTLLGLGFLLCTHGMRTTSVVVAAFVVGTTVVFTPLVTRVWLRCAIRPRTRLAIGLAVLGLGLLTLRGTAAGGGALLILLAALLWSVHLCALGRWVPADRGYPSTIVQLGTAALVAFGCGALTGQLPTPPAADELGAAFYLGAVATAAAFWAVTWAQSRIDATTAAVLLTLEPVVGAAAGVVLLGEAVTPAAVAGVVLILAAGGLVAAPSTAAPVSQSVDASSSRRTVGGATVRNASVTMAVSSSSATVSRCTPSQPR